LQAFFDGCCVPEEASAVRESIRTSARTALRRRRLSVVEAMVRTHRRCAGQPAPTVLRVLTHELAEFELPDTPGIKEVVQQAADAISRSELPVDVLADAIAGVEPGHPPGRHDGHRAVEEGTSSPPWGGTGQGDR
jgi:hypothetical protein